MDTTNEQATQVQLVKALQQLEGQAETLRQALEANERAQQTLVATYAARRRTTASSGS